MAADYKFGPQAFLSSYAPRLRGYNNSLMTPVVNPVATSGPLSRTTKRGTTVINYAEENFDIYDDDDSDSGRRRPTGLRSLRRDDSSAGGAGGGKLGNDASDRVGKEAVEPVDVPGIWREWMGRDSMTKQQYKRSDMQSYAQAVLPLTLVPIRIDVDVPSFVPQAPFPPPQHGGADLSLPQYKPQEPTVPYRLKDIFLWNLHETLITTDQFALTLVQDLDLPNKHIMAAEISKQIRTQLEEYAGVALHPLFHPQSYYGSGSKANKNNNRASLAEPGPGTPRLPGGAAGISRANTPLARNGTPLRTTADSKPSVTADAALVAPDSTPDGDAEPGDDDDMNPDDMYRCVVTLNITLSSQLYTDRFEWSLLHPPGVAEQFARQTCADLGLAGEWVPAVTHAIYEAVLRLKKEACEAGGMVAGWANGSAAAAAAAGLLGGGAAAAPVTDVANDAAHGAEAGWRYDPEQLADEWEPKMEVLSKEEMEKREGDRERQIRRLRRETARFSSNTNLQAFGLGGFGGFGAAAAGPSGGAAGGGGGGGGTTGGGTPFGGAAAAAFFGSGDAQPQTPGAEGGERMGRGERSKKKRRFRSLSPLARAGTPGGRATPDVLVGYGGGGGGGGGGSLADGERNQWRCAHCRVWGTSVWAVRDGPAGPRSLCNNCGFLYERDRKLPLWTKNLHLPDPRPV